MLKRSRSYRFLEGTGGQQGTLLAGILALAAGLRFALLGQNSLWYDEAFVVWVTRLHWQDILSVLKTIDAHPPLYYLLMKGWLNLAGTGETAARIPSAFFSLLSVALTYLLMRRTAPAPVSLLSAFLVSVAPLQIMAGQEARMYSLLGCLALASTLALTASTDQGGPLRWTVYVALATLMIYTQYLGFLVLLAHGLWVAACERRHLARWLAGMAATAILYTPWMPFLWYQTFQGRGTLPWSAYGLGDLLGLFAFGGSLFGMASYFSIGTLGPVEQLILLLPFLVLVAQGVIAVRSDRRSLALLGLPPTMTIAAMLLVSLVKPIFYPRWFSFLLPFYAMFLARGIVHVAERFRGRPDRSLALLTAGLLLYSVPVFARYYFDPTFRPYQWRAAAALVNAQVRPDDFFLFVNHSAEVAFTYYFTQPRPSWTLPLSETAPGRERHPTFAPAQARELGAQHPRVWLIATPPFGVDAQRRLRAALDSAFHVVESRDFTGVWIYLLEAGASPPR